MANERNVFSLPKIEKQFSRYVLVRLYTADDPETNTMIGSYVREHFGSVAQPLYVIMDAQGEVKESFGGTLDADDFYKRLSRY